MALLDMWPWRCGLMARPVSGVEWEWALLDFVWDYVGEPEPKR